MFEFLSTDEFSIYKNKEQCTLFTIKFQVNSESLINSMIKTKLIIGSSISDNYKALTFRASSVKSLRKFISNKENINYENTLKLIVSLTKQIQYLIITECECFYEYIIENIIVIDDDKFIYLSNDDLLKLSESKKFNFTKPFNRTGIISPELLKINSIPSELNYKTIYYSLGALVVYFLFDKNINNKDGFNCDLNEILKPIEGTKLSGLLIRCLFQEANERSIVYI
jgi:hypothetical protein